jgi:hypothetical protein
MVYGIGTRSYNRSGEHREMRRQQAEVTAKFLASPREPFTILLCHCRSFRFGHRPSEHSQLRSERDWRTWQERLT